MHYCRYQENYVLCMVAIKCTLAKPDGILEDVIVEEFMNDNIPLPVVASEVLNIPPVLVELAVTEPDQFSKHIHPIVQNTIK